MTERSASADGGRLPNRKFLLHLSVAVAVVGLAITAYTLRSSLGELPFIRDSLFLPLTLLISGLIIQLATPRVGYRVTGWIVYWIAWLMLLLPYHPFFVGYLGIDHQSAAVTAVAAAVLLLLVVIVLARPWTGFVMLVFLLPLRQPIEVGGITVHLMFAGYIMLAVTSRSLR